MIRMLVMLGCLWALCHWHGAYQSHAVAKAASGQELLRTAGGRVEVTGVVTKRELRTDGSQLLVLDAQGARVTVYAEPLLRLVPPRVGESVRLQAKHLQGGLLVLEAVEDLQTTAPLLQASAGRVDVPVSNVQLLGYTRSGKYREVWFTVENGVRSTGGLVDPDCPGIEQATVLYGYFLPGGRFRIERWQ